MAQSLNPRRDRAPATTPAGDLKPSIDHPLVSWMLNPARWVSAEYQLTEIRLEGGETHVRSLRKTLRDGVVREEKLEAQLGPEAYADALGQMQRQTQALMEMMLLPWLGLLGGALPPGRQRREE